MALDEFGALLQQHTKSPGVDAASSGPTVMVVDDDTGVLGALEAMLKDRYKVITCASGTQAIAAMHDNISAAVLDIKMKDHDGFWVCDALRERNPHIPVIFYSAYQDAKPPFKIINDHRPFGYVTKGTSSGVLLDLIEQAVRYVKVLRDCREVIDGMHRLSSRLNKPRTGPTD